LAYSLLLSRQSGSHRRATRLHPKASSPLTTVSFALDHRSTLAYPHHSLALAHLPLTARTLFSRK
jgi:hypothetical protein